MPLYFKEELKKGVLGIWKIEESSDELSELIELSGFDQEKINSFKLESRKQEYLASRTLIKALLGINPEIKYLPSGKPILKNSNFKLSISHTKSYAAVVLSKEEKVGVDIEIPSERVCKISKRFISDDEESFIPSGNKMEYYTLIWSLKEAMYKIYDNKGIIFNCDLVCKPFVMNKSGKIEAIYNVNEKDCLSYHYKTTPDFYLVYRG